jgi:hypothetical protein
MDITSRLKARVRQIMVQEMFVRTSAVERVQSRIEQAIDEEFGMDGLGRKQAVGRVNMDLGSGEVQIKRHPYMDDPRMEVPSDLVMESDQPDLYNPSPVPGSAGTTGFDQINRHAQLGDPD